MNVLFGDFMGDLRIEHRQMLEINAPLMHDVLKFDTVGED